MHSTLLLQTRHIEEMTRHVVAHAPLEACGLLAGKNARVEVVLPIANAEQNPARFRMEALEQLRAFEWMEARGLELLGIFHSHPAGPATASPTDIAEAAYEVAHIVLSRRAGKWIARGFHFRAGQALEIGLLVE